MLLTGGKMGDANLLDIHENLLVYSYAAHGVEYTASHDVSRLKPFVPGDVASLGPDPGPDPRHRCHSAGANRVT